MYTIEVGNLLRTPARKGTDGLRPRFPLEPILPVCPQPSSPGSQSSEASPGNQALSSVLLFLWARLWLSSWLFVRWVERPSLQGQCRWCLEIPPL